jgi:hypothetical protein
MATGGRWLQDFTSTLKWDGCLYRTVAMPPACDPEGQVNTHLGRLTTRRLHRFALSFRPDCGGFFGDTVITVGYSRSV